MLIFLKADEIKTTTQKIIGTLYSFSLYVVKFRIALKLSRLFDKRVVVRPPTSIKMQFLSSDATYHKCIISHAAPEKA